MELTNLMRVLRRWFWLIVAVVVVTELALWLGTRSAEPVYVTTVKLQLSTPQREEVAAYDEYRSISLRDEITVAINNFIELLQSEEVYKRTISQLGLEGKDALYMIAAERATDADFITVTVEARTPSLVAEIANTHVAIAIAYYGELRAQSTKADENLFAEQLRVAEKELWAAENALAEFRTENGIYSLESQMSTQQRLLEQLQLERDQRLLDQAATVNATTVTPVSTTPAPLVIDFVGEVDKLIAKRLNELEQLTALTPQYNLLTQNVEQAHTVYQHLLSKYSEAKLKITAVQAANFIQVIKPAYLPVGSESSWPKLAMLALAGSLGLGAVLAFLLEYITSIRATSVTVPVSDHKPPSHGHADRALWKRFRNVFHRNDPTYESASLVLSTDPIPEQKPLAVQDQQGSTVEAASVSVPVSGHKMPSRRKRSSRKSRSTDMEQESNTVKDQQGSPESKVA